MWRSRMFWRLFGVYGALLVGALALLGTLVSERVERFYLVQIESVLRSRAQLVREVVRDRSPEQMTELQERMIELRREIDTRITLIAEDGRVLSDSEENPHKMANHADRPEVRAAGHDPFGTATRGSSTLGQDMMYVALRAKNDDNTVFFVRVALPLDTIKHQQAELRRLIWSAALLTGITAVALSFWLARRITRPLQKLTRGVERLAAGDFGHKIYIGGHDEVDSLAQTFNRMSERLAAQFTQLEEDRHQLRTILSGMVEGVIALDAEQRILFVNDRAAELLDFSTTTAVGRMLWEMVRQRTLHDVVRRAMAGPTPLRQELSWNATPTMSLTVHAAPLPGTPARGAVLVLHDTSELRRLEQLRQEFVANVSHELKTPLSVIKACIETLLDGAAADETHRGAFLEQISEQAERLHTLILDLLSLARIESGAELLHFQKVPMDEVVHDCLDRHRARAESKQQVLETHEPQQPGDPAVAWADEEAVSQILDNLVDNALKYTPPGGHIHVHWGIEDNQVCLEVKDTGIGIPERDLPRIFERFYRVDKARSRALGGTGLGLSIVKHLVQSLQGSVSATSRLGQGTTFRVRLPRANAA